MQKANATERNFAAEFDAQRPLAKKEIYKLPAGTWVELRWRDAPNTVQLLACRVKPGQGDCRVYTSEVVNGSPVLDRVHTQHDQIVATHGRINVIAPPPSRS